MTTKSRLESDWKDAAERARVIYYSPWMKTFRTLEANYKLLDGEMLEILTFAFFDRRTKFPQSRGEFKHRWLEIWAAYRAEQLEPIGVGPLATRLPQQRDDLTAQN